METKNKISKKLMLAWPTRTISITIAAVLFGYITFYATDYMKIPAATVGLIFMFSKIFDGFTDFVAGYLIDKTNTKMGKARPYELSLIGYWITMVLMFSAPELGIAPSCVYLFVMYSLVNSVFLTLLNCNEPVYLANAIDNPEDSVSVLAMSGFISLVFTMGISMILPQYVANVQTRGDWTKIALVLAVPFTLFGLIRFFLIKEKKKVDVTAVQEFSVKEMFKLLSQNKYIVLFTLMIFLSNVGSNLVNNVQTYYFLYIVGDIALSGVLALSMLAIIIVVVTMPFLSKKFGFLNVMRAQV